MAACVKMEVVQESEGVMTHGWCVLVHVSIFEKSMASAYDLMDVHLWKVGVRPFPVRKEVEMTRKTPGPPKIDQNLQKKISKMA